MRVRALPPCLALVVALLGGCLEDPTPNQVRLRMEGPAGEQVLVVLSTEFLAGTNESGVLQVNILVSDTIVGSFPIDTEYSILPDRIFFAQAAPIGPDTLPVNIRLDADTRNLFDGSGLISTPEPWRFLYLFNTNLLTSNLEVVF